MSTLTFPSAAPSRRRTSASPDTLWWLYVLFFLSGISGLMYEVVWVRMLTRVLGSTVYATSTVLAAFMAGLALGSFLIGRFIDRVRWPLRWYAFLELGIGLTALATLVLPEQMVPVYQTLYDTAGGSRAWLTAGQVAIALLVLLLPTALMGATLPTLCAYGGRSHLDFGRWVGLLYSLNTLGAVVGIVSSGFVLIGTLGETLTVALGAGLNVVVAAAAWVRGGQAAATETSDAESVPLPGDRTATVVPTSSYPASCRRAILGTFALGGFVALANEVVWGRMLLLYQGTSIYAFSSMLAVVLCGMGIGSYVGGKYGRHWGDPLRLLARLQLAIGLAALIALHLFAYLKPGLIWPAVVLLGPLGLLWGLVFPMGAACYTRSQAGAGRSIAALYAWNTCGCIAGSLAAGFVLLPLLGSSRTVACLAALSLVLGLLLLWVHPQGFRRQARWLEGSLVGACALLLLTLGDPYYQALERSMLERWPSGVEVLAHVEDSTATMTAFRRQGGEAREKQLWINGQGMTLMTPVTKLMAHLPIALADEPHDVLIICFGMGTTVRSVSRHEGLNIRAVELVPAVIDSFGLFHADGPQILQRSNVQAVADDGRNYLLMHPQQYDVITIDPPPPLHSAGAVNLYTREFFVLCRERLRPGGVVCLWIPPEEPLSEVKMIQRTYLDVFAQVKAWSGPESFPGVLLIGSHRPLAMAHVPSKIRKLYENPAVRQDLREWGSEFDQPDRILDLFAADEQQLRAQANGARIITDDHPYTEFFAWRSWGLDREFHSSFRAFSYKHPTQPSPSRNPYE